MKKSLLFCMLFFYVATLQAQPSPSPENFGKANYADPLPMPYLLYPFPGMKLPFTPDEFVFMWEIDSIKYPPEKYTFKYDFLLVRVEKGQSPEEAINKNKPIYEKKDVTGYYINYPWNAMELSDDQYAWQVSSKNDDEFVRSEIKSFIIDHDKAIPPYILRINNNYYTELREKLDASFRVAYGNKLWIKYEELYEGNNQRLRFKVYNDANEVIIETDESGVVQNNVMPQVMVNTGINYLILNFETALPISWSAFYVLEVWNAKNERWYLRFTTDYIRYVVIRPKE